MSPPDSVVFPSGEHFYAGDHGQAVVRVPRDVTLNEILPALSRLVLSAEDGEERNEKAA